MSDRTNNDAAKCRGEVCPVRDRCDRFVRPAGDRQTFFLIPKHEQTAECKHFVPLQPKEAPRG